MNSIIAKGKVIMHEGVKCVMVDVKDHPDLLDGLQPYYGFRGSLSNEEIGTVKKYRVYINSISEIN